VPTAGQLEAATGAASTGAATSSATDTSTSSTATDTSTSFSETTTDTSSGSTTETTVQTSDSTTTEPSEPKPVVRFFAGRVDVAMGPIGEVKKYRNVHYLDFLPGDKNPLVSFMTLDGTGRSAVFAISNEIAETDGDGHCTPHEVDGCDLLTLKVGDERILHTVGGPDYRLKLLDTNIVRVPDPRTKLADAK
jgi:hypothetical protein